MTFPVCKLLAKMKPSTLIIFMSWLLMGCPQTDIVGPDLFFLPETYPVGKKPATVVAHDMNKDGFADILVPNSGDQTLHFYEGTGNGKFKTALVMKTGREPVALEVGDFDGDEIPDIAVCDYGDGNVLIILGQKDGLFRKKDKFKVGRLPIAIASADFNNDSKLDLAVTLRFDKLVII